MRKCEICGKWFEEKTETAKYCGYECRKVRRRELSARYRKQRADKRGENVLKAIETDEKTTNAQRLEAYISSCRNHGLTYGQMRTLEALGKAD